MKALLELKKPTLMLAGKGRAPGTLGCSGRGWRAGALWLKLAGIWRKEPGLRVRQVPAQRPPLIEVDRSSWAGPP